jgi:ribosomal protein L35
MPLKFLLEHAGKHLGREYCEKWALEAMLTHLLRHHQALCWAAFNRWITRNIESKAAVMAEADRVHHYLRGFRILQTLSRRHFLRTGFTRWWKRYDETLQQLMGMFDQEYIAQKARYGQVTRMHHPHEGPRANEGPRVNPPIRWMSVHAKMAVVKIQTLTRAALGRRMIQRRREQRRLKEERIQRTMQHAIRFERAASSATIAHQNRVQAELRKLRMGSIEAMLKTALDVHRGWHDMKRWLEARAAREALEAAWKNSGLRNLQERMATKLQARWRCTHAVSIFYHIMMRVRHACAGMQKLWRGYRSRWLFPPPMGHGPRWIRYVVDDCVMKLQHRWRHFSWVVHMLKVCAERKRLKLEAERARLAAIQLSHDLSTLIGCAWRCSVARQWRNYLQWMKDARVLLEAAAALRLTRSMRVLIVKHRISVRAAARRIRRKRNAGYRRRAAELAHVAAAKIQARVRAWLADETVKRTYGDTIHRALAGTVVMVSNFFVPVGYEFGANPPLPPGATWLAPWLAQKEGGLAVKKEKAKEEEEEVDLTMSRLVAATLRVQTNWGLKRLRKIIAHRREVLDAMLRVSLWAQAYWRMNVAMRQFGSEIGRMTEAYYARLKREEEARTLAVRTKAAIIIQRRWRWRKGMRELYRLFAVRRRAWVRLVLTPAAITMQRYWRGWIARWRVWRMKWATVKREETEAYMMWLEDKRSKQMQEDDQARRAVRDARMEEDIRQAGLRRGAKERAKAWKICWTDGGGGAGAGGGAESSHYAQSMAGAEGGWYFYNSLTTQTEWYPPVEHIRLQTCRICKEHRGLTLNIDAWWRWGKGEEKEGLDGGVGIFYCVGCMVRYAECERVLSLPLPPFEEWGWTQQYHCSSNTVAYWNSATEEYEYSPPRDRPTESVWAEGERKAALEKERQMFAAHKAREEERQRRLAMAGGKDKSLEMWEAYHKKDGLAPDLGKTWEEREETGENHDFVKMKHETDMKDQWKLNGLEARVQAARQQRLKNKAEGHGFVVRAENKEREKLEREKRERIEEEEEAEREAYRQAAEQAELEYKQGQMRQDAMKYQKELVSKGQWAGNKALDGGELLTSKQRLERDKAEARAKKAAFRDEEKKEKDRKDAAWRALMRGEVTLEERLRNFYKVHDPARLEGGRAKTVGQMAEAYEGKEFDLDVRLESEYGAKMAPVPKASALAPHKKERTPACR